MPDHRPYKNMTIEQLENGWHKWKKNWDKQDDYEKEYALRLGVTEREANKILYAKEKEIGQRRIKLKGQQ